MELAAPRGRFPRLPCGSTLRVEDDRTVPMTPLAVTPLVETPLAMTPLAMTPLPMTPLAVTQHAYDSAGRDFTCLTLLMIQRENYSCDLLAFFRISRAWVRVISDTSPSMRRPSS